MRIPTIDDLRDAFGSDEFMAEGYLDAASESRLRELGAELARTGSNVLTDDDWDFLAHTASVMHREMVEADERRHRRFMNQRDPF